MERTGEPTMARRSHPSSAARGHLGRGALAILSTVVALGLAEALARGAAIDQRLLLPALFFQGADVAVHRISADPALHYELAPGTSCDCSIGGPRYRVTIDEHGARHPTHPLAKAPDAYRILCVGGSTMYGGAVNDAETMPAALERQLAAGAPAGRRYEAWNFGTSAYMLRQAAHLAETRLDDLRPDLVLVQLFNSGRRAFLMPPSNDAFDYDWRSLIADPDFFIEQFAYPAWLPAALVAPVLRRSALARAGLAVAPGFEPNLRCAWCEQRDQDAARALSRAADARGISVVYFAIPATRCAPDGTPEPRRPSPGPDSVYPGLDPRRFVDLFEADREPAFYRVHPPPPILEEYARLLAAALRARGILGPS
jgi:hypothetical protein